MLQPFLQSWFIGIIVIHLFFLFFMLNYHLKQLKCLYDLQVNFI